MKPPRTSTSNTKNIRREIIQIIFLDLKGHWNQAQKPPKTSTNHKLVKLYGFKPSKPRRTSATNLPPQTFKYEEHSKQNHLNYLPRSQRSLESSSKASRNLTNHKSVKLYGSKPLKHRRTSTTNLQRRRTHQEHVKNTKNTKNEEFLTSL